MEIHRIPSMTNLHHFETREDHRDAEGRDLAGDEVRDIAEISTFRVGVEDDLIPMDFGPLSVSFMHVSDFPVDGKNPDSLPIDQPELGEAMPVLQPHPNSIKVWKYR